MSEEQKEQTESAKEEAGGQAAGAETAAPEAGKKEPIRIELEDLTEEGKKKTEEALHRPIEDLGYTLVSQETRPGSVLVLKFALSREVYLADQGRLLEDLRKETVLPGFRKGKAPLKLLQIRLGEDAIRDTVRSLGINALRQETAKQGFKFITKPQIAGYSVPDEPGASLTFEVDAEVEPQVEAREYQGLKVEVEIHPVTDEMVEERLQALRRENAVLEATGEDATVNPDDSLTVDIVVTNEAGERMENMSKQNQLIQRYLQELPEPVAAQLTGKKAGETVTAGVEHKALNRRGEEVAHTDTWSVTVREIKMNKLPSLDDEFAKDLGDYETLQDLRNKLRDDLVKAEELRQRSEALAKLHHQIVERNPLDPPRSLLAQEAYNMIMEDQYQLTRLGLRLEQVVQDADKYLSVQRAEADELVKTQLLLDQIAKNENLEVTEEDVDKAIAEEAERTGRKPLAARARLEAQKQLEQFRVQVGRRKLGDFLLANNTVQKVPLRKKEKAENPAE